MLNLEDAVRAVLQKVEEEKRNGGKPTTEPPETKPYIVAIEKALDLAGMADPTNATTIEKAGNALADAAVIHIEASDNMLEFSKRLYKKIPPEKKARFATQYDEPIDGAMKRFIEIFKEKQEDLVTEETDEESGITYVMTVRHSHDDFPNAYKNIYAIAKEAKTLAEVSDKAKHFILHANTVPELREAANAMIKFFCVWGTVSNAGRKAAMETPAPSCCKHGGQCDGSVLGDSSMIQRFEKAIRRIRKSKGDEEKKQEQALINSELEKHL